MTNEHTIGGATIMSPTSTNNLKQSLRGYGKKNGTDVHIEEATLIKAEQKLLDEEITSIESALDGHGRDDVEHVEEAMLNAALMQSVAETTAHVSAAAAPASSSTDKGKPGAKRYGLRKRKRPSGNDLKRLENIQTVKEGNSTRVIVKREVTNDDGGGSSQLVPQRQLQQQQQQSRRAKQSLSKNAGKDTLSLSALSSPSSIASITYPTSVPNPLSIPIDAPSEPPAILRPRSTARTVTVIQTQPDPLSLINNVPCPLPSENDLGLQPYHPAQEFNIPDVNEKPRVTFSDSPPQLRDRGFSIDLDLALEFAADEQGGDGGDLVFPDTRRDRAYSFECFAFGISSDEPLPPIEQSTSNNNYPYNRPRGDSIIFDPSSFQEGGIHEQTALETATVTVADNVDSLVDSILSGIHDPPNSIRSAVPLPEDAPVVVPSSTYSSMADPVIGADETSTSPSAILSCGTLPYEILNKDGRIGIYLPEARRHRIARFHAKRSRRIWRKRIKYDCRKKLADSRPRIKGRFVKRVDNDED